MRQSEWPALQRLDMSYTLPFLSACAAALCESGLASDQDADSLRETIKDQQRQREEMQQPLLAQLLQKKNSIMAFLQARYGIAGLDTLLFRWTISRVSEDLASELWNFSEDLIKKSELLFNQPMLLVENGEVERRSLVSIFLVDAASQCGSFAEQLQLSAAAFRTHYPLSASEDGELENIDNRLAAHLGFALGDTEVFSSQKLGISTRQLYAHLENLCCFLSAIMAHISFNCTDSDHHAEIVATVEELRGELGRLEMTPIYAPSTLAQMENRRMRLLGVMLIFKAGIHGVRQHFQAILRTSRLSTPAEWVWPMAERRQLLSILLSRSVSVQDAELAIESLERYCRQHLVAPDQLLEAELNRIHPQLDEASLRILRKIAMDKGIGQALSREKKVVLHRKDKLLHVIQTNLNRVLVLTFLCLCIPGCGWKTEPISEVLDLRPAVPYHAKQRTIQKSTEKPDQPPPSVQQEK